MRVDLAAPPPRRWIPARAGDAPALAELRAEVMRPSLTRLGRYDDTRVRTRFLTGFDPARTRVLVDAGAETAGPVGSIALRPAADGVWVEHFYVDPALQGRGVGTAALAAVTAAADRTGSTLRLDVLQGSDALRLYVRHGFVRVAEDAVDVFLRRDPRAVAGSAGGAVERVGGEPPA